MSPKQIALVKKWKPILDRCREINPVFHIAMATDCENALQERDTRDERQMSFVSREIERIRKRYSSETQPIQELGARKLIL